MNTKYLVVCQHNKDIPQTRIVEFREEAQRFIIETLYTPFCESARGIQLEPMPRNVEYFDEIAVALKEEEVPSRLWNWYIFEINGDGTSGRFYEDPYSLPSESNSPEIPYQVQRAMNVLSTYEADQGDPDNLRDLLADLMWWASYNNYDFEYVRKVARENFRAEKTKSWKW